MSEETTNKKQRINALTGKQYFAIVVTILVVIGLWAINWKLLVGNTKNSSLGERGTFGDMFGAVNALFSGLAFAGIIWTILLQRNELKLQREESQASREEAIAQNKTLRLQRFENTFFNMLSLQNEIVKSLQSQRYTGRSVILQAKRDLFAFLSIENYNKLNNIEDLAPQRNSLNKIPQSKTEAHSLLEVNYHKLYYDYYASSFNHYFRHLYHIFKFIYFSKLTKTEKKFYATLARAQLSQDELFLISFNMLISGYGHPKFLYLIKEYDILQNFAWDDVQPEMFKQLMKEQIVIAKYPFDEAMPESVTEED